MYLEFLAWLHPDALSRAQTREDLLGSLRYRRTNRDLSDRPPTRVELLIEILSWKSLKTRWITSYSTLQWSSAVSSLERHVQQFPSVVGLISLITRYLYRTCRVTQHYKTGWIGLP